VRHVKWYKYNISYIYYAFHEWSSRQRARISTVLDCKKDIAVFQKCIILFPIHLNLNWSFIIVINPDNVVMNFWSWWKTLENVQCEFVCILFMDIIIPCIHNNYQYRALDLFVSYYDSAKYQILLRSWLNLNAEWTQVGHGKIGRANGRSYSYFVQLYT